MKGKAKAARLEVVHPDCAGIDVGKRKHYVAVDPSRFECSAFRLVHGRFEADGRLAGLVRGQASGDGIHGRVLDSGV